MSTTSTKRISETPGSGASSANVAKTGDDDYSTTPEFIYGGPFIKVEKPSPFINTATPINLQLQGTFKNSVSEVNSNRRRRVTLLQLEALLEFVKTHRDIAMGYNKTAQAREDSKRMWESVAASLNAQGQGAEKTWKEWSSYWVDYKSKLKRRVAAVRRSFSSGAREAPLTEIELKYLALISENKSAGSPKNQVDPHAANTDKGETSVSQSEGILRQKVEVSSEEEVLSEDEMPSEEMPSEEMPSEEEMTSEEMTSEEMPSQKEVPSQKEEPYEVKSEEIPSQEEVSSQKEVLSPEIPHHSKEPPSVEAVSPNNHPSSFRERRRRRKQNISKDDTRATLIEISKKRLAVEEKNGETLQQILLTLQKLVNKIDRLM